MGIICTKSSSVASVSIRLELMISAAGHEPEKLSPAPRSFQALVRQVEYMYHIPPENVILRGKKNNKEFDVVDDKTFTEFVQDSGASSIQIRVEQRVLRKTSDLMPVTGVSEEVISWGILKPVPIDVDIKAVPTFLSRQGSLHSSLAQSVPKAYTCTSGHLLMFDSATTDCFKFNHSSVEETSRAAAGPNGTVFVTGGINASKQLLKIDVATGNAKQSTPLPRPRHSHASVFLGTSLWVIGGLSPSGESLSSCDCYDREAWQNASSLCRPRSCHNACVYVESIFVVAGREEATIEKMENGAWKVLGVSLPTALSFPGVYIHNREKLVIAGGTPDSEDTDAVWFLVLSESVLVPGPPLPHEDHFAAAGLAVDATGYLVGAIGRFVLEIDAWRMLN